MNRNIITLGLAGLLGLTLLGGCKDRSKDIYFNSKPLMTQTQGGLVLTSEAIEDLEAKGVLENVALAYAKSGVLSPWQNPVESIPALIKGKVSSKELFSYMSCGEDLSCTEVLAMKQAGVSPADFAQGVPMSSWHIMAIKNLGIPLNFAVDLHYVRSLHGRSDTVSVIKNYRDAGLSAEQVKNYPSDMYDDNVILFAKANITPETLRAYERVGVSIPQDVLDMNSLKVSPETVAKYIQLNRKYQGVKINGSDAIEFIRNGTSIEQVEAECKKVDLEQRLRQ